VALAPKNTDAYEVFLRIVAMKIFSQEKSRKTAASLVKKQPVY